MNKMFNFLSTTIERKRITSLVVLIAVLLYGMIVGSMCISSDEMRSVLFLLFGIFQVIAVYLLIFKE